eukprot:tig00020629_g12357.t1
MPQALIFDELGNVHRHSLPTGHTVKVSGGPLWRLALAEDGALFYEEASEEGMLQERMLEFERIAQISTSSTHAAVVTENGLLYTWGMGDKGSLGLGGIRGKSFPQLVERRAFGKVAKVSCGVDHTVLVNERGEVYAAGSSSWGQLGVGPLRKTQPGGEKQPQMNFRCVLSLWRAKRRIVGVACGAYHTVLLADDGGVFTFGWGGSGALGQANHKSLAAPVQVESLREKHVKKIAAGYGHTLVSTGFETLASGLNNYGQLGLGDTRQRTTFTEIEQLRDRGVVSEIAAADFASFAIIAGRGELLSWGTGALGFPPPPPNPTLLHQPKPFEALPRSVTALGTAPVISVNPAPQGWVFSVVLES